MCMICVRLQAFYYPPDAGLAIGGPGSSRFLRLEVHYHNPLLIAGTHSYCMNTLFLRECFFPIYLKLKIIFLEQTTSVINFR